MRQLHHPRKCPVAPTAWIGLRKDPGLPRVALWEGHGRVPLPAPAHLGWETPSTQPRPTPTGPSPPQSS
eukprot:2208898-Prorocentrum_lima.AAC.1